MKLHNIHSMNAIRLECTLLIKLIWVMLNWSILRLFEEILSCELSLKWLQKNGKKFCIAKGVPIRHRLLRLTAMVWTQTVELEMRTIKVF